MTPRIYGRKRARTAVWAAVAAFVAATLTLNALLDTSRSQYRDPEFAWHARHTAKRQAHEPNRELGIVLGTSRAHVGFDPAELGLPDDDSAPLVANFAQTGSVPVYSMMNLRRILALGFRPAFVLFEIMPVVLVADVPAEDLIPPHRMGYADSVATRGYSTAPNAWLSYRVAPWYSYRNNILAHHAPNWVPEETNLSWMWTRPGPAGWLNIGFDEVPQERREKLMVTVRESYRQAFTNYEIAPRSDRAVRELLQICRDNGIPAVGIRMPESPLFRSWYPPGAKAVIETYLASLLKDFDFACYDCTAWMAETDFLDGHHLLRPGAAKFSRRFGAECLQPWLESLKRKKAATP